MVSVKPIIEQDVALHPAVQEFAQGVDDMQPNANIVEMAARIVQGSDCF